MEPKDKITAPEAAAAEEKVLAKEVKETKVLGDGKLVTTLQELREAGYVSPNDRRIAMAVKGGPVPNDIVNAPAIPIERDEAQIAEVTKAVTQADEATDAEGARNTGTPKEKLAKAKLASK